jgi:phenylacetate-CoA ligase
VGDSALPPFDAWGSSAIAADVAAASIADEAGLAARREERLGALLAAAARHSPLYRRMLRGRDLSTLALQQLPIMHKAELIARFEDWVGDPDLRRPCAARPLPKGCLKVLTSAREGMHSRARIVR